MTDSTRPPIGFIDLLAQRRRLGTRIDDAVMGVINGGAYIMGPQVQAFEAALAEFGQSKYDYPAPTGQTLWFCP